MIKIVRYPDEEAGQIPMAFVVRQPQSSLSEAEIIDFVAKQVLPWHNIAYYNLFRLQVLGKFQSINMMLVISSMMFPGCTIQENKACSIH